MLLRTAYVLTKRSIAGHKHNSSLTLILNTVNHAKPLLLTPKFKVKKNPEL